MHYQRRTFLKHLSLTLGSTVLSWKSSLTSPLSTMNKLKIGIIADAHKDIMYDADSRLEAFMKACEEKSPNFIIQIGDFCFPIKENKSFFRLWEQYEGPRHHVLGNHDMDVSSKAETLDYWEMPSNYYSFDQGGYHFIVLDANYLYQDGKYTDYEKGNFYVDSSLRTFIHPEQIEWLEEDLTQTDKLTFVFSHQGLANDFAGVKNRLKIQETLEAENRRVGFQKVIACFNGHNHIDFHRTINDIHYININSLSYKWVGDKYENKSRYESQVYDQYPSMAYIVPYKDPLFAFITIDPKGILTIEGAQSTWISPSPEELGIPETVLGNKPFPYISDREISFDIP